MAKPPTMQGHQFEVEIREDGVPTRPGGEPILEASPLRQDALPAHAQLTQERADAFVGGGQGIGGDGWPGDRSGTFQKQATGIGTSRDKTTYGNYWAPWRIMDSELLAMFNGSALAKRIVSEIPEEMFREGWEVRARDLKDDDLKTLDRKAASLRVPELLLQGKVWGRLFGGALNLIGAEDGRNPDEPLNEEAIRTLHYINVVDRRFVWVQRYYSDMLSPKFGLPEVYLITNVVS